MSSVTRLKEFAQSNTIQTSNNAYDLLGIMTKSDRKSLRKIAKSKAFCTKVADSFIYVNSDEATINKLRSLGLITLSNIPVQSDNVSKYFFCLTKKGVQVLTIIDGFLDTNKKSKLLDVRTNEAEEEFKVDTIKMYKSDRMNIPAPPTEEDIIRRFGPDAPLFQTSVILNKHKTNNNRRLARYLARKFNEEEAEFISVEKVVKWIDAFEKKGAR